MLLDILPLWPSFGSLARPLPIQVVTICNSGKSLFSCPAFSTCRQARPSRWWRTRASASEIDSDAAPSYNSMAIVATDCSLQSTFESKLDEGDVIICVRYRNTEYLTFNKQTSQREHQIKYCLNITAC
jgi:hypothetical protein